MRAEMHRPVKVWVQATGSCNLNCAVCYEECAHHPTLEELSTDEHLSLIDYFVDTGVMHVMYEGGEPLLRPDLLEIVRYAGRKMLTWVRTNATLVTPETAADLREAGVNTIIVDCFGATAPTHDEITGVGGSFERTIEGIKILKAAGHRLVMAFILNRINAHELQRYTELAAELGVPRVGCLRLYPLGRARDNWQRLSLSLEEMTDVLGSVDPPDGVTLMQSWHPKNSNCCWQNAAIDAVGTSIGCPYLRGLVDYGNIRETTLLDTWDDPFYRKLREANSISDGCEGCADTSGTNGGCRSTAFAFTGSWEGLDPYCQNMNQGQDLTVLPLSTRRIDGPVYRAPRKVSRSTDSEGEVCTANSRERR